MESRSIKTLKESTENPRKISVERRAGLKRSIEKYGDLSGIVRNVKTGNLVGGHQRTGMFRKAKGVRIEAHPHTDSTGTVAIGEVIIPVDKNSFIRIPYREVSWDGDREMAANIAANAGGGDFDYTKLKNVLTRLDKHKFPIETAIPFDDLPLRKAVLQFEGKGVKLGVSNKKRKSRETKEAETKNTSGSECTCPRCSFKWRV